MSSQTNYAIEIKGISHKFNDVQALDNVTFQVEAKSLCALVGPNGAGKSTLIKAITGLIKPDRGNSEVHCSHSHKGHSIGYVPQRHIIPNDFPVSVFEAVSSGRTLGNKKWFRLNKADKEIISHAIESVGLTDYKHTRLDRLSGGQQQRVLIAKAFASEPDLLILDEPTAGVDSASQELFRNSLSHIIEEHDTTVLLVSHELSAVSDLVDQIVVLKNKVLFDGTPNELSQKGVSLGIHEHDLPIWLERLEHDTFNEDRK